MGSDDVGGRLSTENCQPDGPYLLLAALCQRAQQDQYGSLSIINVLEQLVVGSDAADAPERMPTFRFQANLAVSMAAGDVRGVRTLSIVPHQPSGERLDAVSQPVEFKGQDQRVTFISNVSMDMTHEGIYWFEVRLDGRLMTQIPLRVTYERNYQQPWKTITVDY